ncbi:hypothetical protein ACYJ2U_001622 [Clostridium botulinum]
MNKDKFFQLGDDIEVSLTDSKENEIFKFNSKAHDKKMENKKLNDEVKILTEIINNTWDEVIAGIRDKNKKTEFKNNEMNRITTDSIVKEHDKVIKAVTDNRKDLNQYDIVRIVDGKYKALSDRKCRFLDYSEGIDKVFLQLDNLNSLYVNPEDIELVKKAKKEYDITIFNKMEKRNEKIKIVEDNNWITVILEDGTKSKKELKGENKTRIIEIVYYKAKARQYTKLRKELINNLTNIK